MGIQVEKLIRCAVGTGIYVFVLLLVFVIHARFFPVGVVLYSAICDAMIATVICYSITVIFPWFAKLQSAERVLLVAVWMLGGYGFAISGPALLDRSLSFYILEKLDRHGGALSRGELERVVSHDYFPELLVFEARLTEQIESGTIEVNKECVRLTPKGASLAEFSAFVRSSVLPKHRLLVGEYTDVLTKPIVASAAIAQDGCG